MPNKTISVSAISHHPKWDVSGGDLGYDCTKYNVRCVLHLVGGLKAELDLAAQVSHQEDWTEDRIVSDGTVSGVEFFWEERVIQQTLRRKAWYDRPRSDLMKPWAWSGIFWLCDTFRGDIYEHIAVVIDLKKYEPPEWPQPQYLGQL